MFPLSTKLHSSNLKFSCVVCSLHATARVCSEDTFKSFPVLCAACMLQHVCAQSTPSGALFFHPVDHGFPELYASQCSLPAELSHQLSSSCFCSIKIDFKFLIVLYRAIVPTFSLKALLYL